MASNSHLEQNKCTLISLHEKLSFSLSLRRPIFSCTDGYELQIISIKMNYLEALLALVRIGKLFPF